MRGIRTLFRGVIGIVVTVVSGVGVVLPAEGQLEPSRFQVQAEWQNAGDNPVVAQQEQGYNPDFNLFWFSNVNDAAVKNLLATEGQAQNPPVTPDFGSQTNLGVSQTTIIPASPPLPGNPAVFGSINSQITVDPQRRSRLIGVNTFVAQVFMDGGSDTFDANVTPSVSLELSTIEPDAGRMRFDAAIGVQDPANPETLGPEHTWAVTRDGNGTTSSGNLFDTGRFSFPTPSTSTFSDDTVAPSFDFTGLAQGQRLEFSVMLGIEVDNQGDGVAQIDAANTLDWSFAIETPGVRLVPVLESTSIAGNYDGSDQVDQGDLDLVLLNWGQSTPPVPAGWVEQFPVGQIDQSELDGVLLNWGARGDTGANTSPIPEPTAGLVALAGVPVFVRLRPVYGCRKNRIRHTPPMPTAG